MVYVQKLNTTNVLTEQEIKGLVHMVEEEKLAGDVYQTLHAKTGLINFQNIEQSERRHQSAVQGLLQKYGIADPTAGKGVGEFTQTEFTNLYQDLVRTGAQSNADALKVGLKIEDLDIYDLEKEIAHTERADIQQVYANLTRGSRNHLRSFHRALSQMGQSYTPELLSQTQYDAIAHSAQERGNGVGCSGKGQGRWQGKTRIMGGARN